MAPALLFVLALFAADVDADAPVATAPEARPARDVPERTARPPLEEPASDYELVAWCYGALGGHMGLHDIAMPEVERIERQWAASPEEAEEDLKSYAVQQEEGAKALALFRDAMEAAEKASIDPIQEKGVASIRKGEAIWMGAGMADPKRLAREWMSWGLPERCATTAEKLEAEATVLGQALSYNVEDEASDELSESEAAAMEAEALKAAEDAVDWDETEEEAPASIDELLEQAN